MKLWRWILLAGSLLFIAKATLTPGTGGAAGGLRPDIFCIACGTEGGADVTLNIALFMPLGAALALLGVSPLRALLIGALLSLGVECAQYSGVPTGRVASFTDLLTNSSGAVLGALITWHRRAWLRPSPRVASALSIASITTLIAFLSFTAWALGRESTTNGHEASYRQNAFAYTPGYGWYHGEVSRVTIGQRTFRWSSNGPIVLRSETTQDMTGSVAVRGRDERRDFVPFLYVHGALKSVPELMLGQRDTDAQLYAKTRGATLRLAGLSFRLHDAFGTVTDTLRLFRFDVTSRRWALAVQSRSQTLATELPITLSLGWTLFQIVLHPGDRGAGLMSLGWMIVFWIPIGYWCAIADARPRTVARDLPTGKTPGWRFILTAIVALVATLVVVPALADLSATLPTEWLCAAAGLSTGVFFAMRSYHQQPSPSL